MSFFKALALTSSRKRNEQICDLKFLRNDVARYQNLHEDIVALIFHFMARRFIKELWHDNNSFFGVTDAEIRNECMFLVINKKIVEIIVYERDITVVASAPDEFFVCTSLSFSSSDEKVVAGIQGMFSHFLDGLSEEDIKKEAKKILDDFCNEAVFSVEVIEYFDLKEQY